MSAVIKPVFVDSGDQVAAEKRLDELVDAAANRLAESMQTGYPDGFETRLTLDALATFLPAAEPERAKVLEYALTGLVRDRMRGLVTVECFLNEADFGSYVATDEMAAVLLAEIRRQGAQEGTLRRLVVEQIVDRAAWQRLNLDDEPDASEAAKR